MILVTLDLLGDIINNIVWLALAVSSGDPLYNLGSSF